MDVGSQFLRRLASRFKLLALFTCVALTGCVILPLPPVPTGSTETRRGASEIKPGETTKDQVIALLGDPDIEGYPSGSLHYYEETIPARQCAVIILLLGGFPGIAPVGGGCEKKGLNFPWWLQIQINEKNLVQTVKIQRNDDATEGYKKVRLAYLNDSATNGNRDAALDLANDFNDLGPLRELAQGDAKAALALAKAFNDPESLRKLGDAGDPDAALMLLKHFDDTSPLSNLAAKGEYAALYEAYLHYKNDQRHLRDSWRWLCQAADGGFAQAREDVAWWYREDNWKLDDHSGSWGESYKNALSDLGVRADDQTAYMWLVLAGNTPLASSARKTLNNRMSQDDILRAKQRATDWKRGQCPSKENPL